MISSRSYDGLIVGGGPAGSALAIALAQAGRHAVLIERSKEAQHKMCGDFLSPECLPFLRRIDIHPEAMGAETIRALRIAARDVLAEVPLPVPALSLTRRRLDEALLQRAKLAGVSLLRGYTVEELSPQTGSEALGRWRAQIRDTSQVSIVVEGGEAFLATGKHDLRGWQRSAEGSQNTLVAMKMYFALSPDQQARLAGHVELILYPGGYAGLQPVEDGAANLCALITREKLVSFSSHRDGLLNHMQHYSPHLAQRLSGARPILERPLALASIPYGHLASVSLDEPSLWRLGDQAAVIPSFCGEGIAIALYTAHRAAELYLDGSTSIVFHKEIRRQFERRLYLATMLSRLIIAAPSLAQALRLWPSVLTDIFTATRLSRTEVEAARY